MIELNFKLMLESEGNWEISVGTLVRSLKVALNSTKGLLTVKAFSFMFIIETRIR